MKNLVCVILALAPVVFPFKSMAACLEGNCWDGQGTYVYPSGAKYTGQFKNGKIDGFGTLWFSKGDVYVGEWRNHYREGQGRLTFKNGNEYIGTFKRSEFSGTGTMNYANGDRYTGNWSGNLPQGFGKYFFESGERYEGNFKNGKFEGQGTMFYTDGAWYEGNWKNNEKNGSGSLFDSRGKKRSGYWVNGELQEKQLQQATSEMANLANCTDGNCLNGQGYYIYADGSRYEGTFQNGHPEGHGKVYYANGDVYEGGWSNHAPHGEGIIHFANGRVFGGVWRYGKAVKKLDAPPKTRFQEEVETEFDQAVKIWAVVVGVGRYSHMPTLRYTDDDAYKMYAFLKSVEGGALPDEQINVLVDEDATHNQVLKSMREVLLKADENDVVLFYFSGHGIDGSFLPVDYDGYHNQLRHDEIRQILDASKAKHKIVFADACHSGSLLATRGLVQNALGSFYNAFEDSAGGLALLMSSKGEEYSLEDGGLRSGIFSYFLIKGLKGAADTNYDKIVTIQEIFNYVSISVRDYTAGAQTPTITGHFDNNMPVAIRR